MFYNKRLFEEAGVKVPTTIDEFFEVSAKLTKPGQYAYFIDDEPSRNQQDVLRPYQVGIWFRRAMVTQWQIDC